MKFRVTMKNPDALDNALESLEEQMIEHAFLDKEEREQKINEARDFANRWMRWGEYIDVEFDTKEGTATIV